MRNNLLIGISSAVAAVAVAGSANAAVTSLYDFQTTFTSPATNAGDSLGVGSVGGNNAFNEYIWNRDLNEEGSSEYNIVSGVSGTSGTPGSLTISIAGTNKYASFGVNPSDQDGSVDLSGTTAIEINVIASSGMANWSLEFADAVGGLAYWSEAVGAAGLKTFTLPASNTEAGFDWSKIISVTIVVTGSSSDPDGSVSINSLNAVPAPGALALLGVAGLAGARRRRA